MDRRRRLIVKCNAVLTATMIATVLPMALAADPDLRMLDGTLSDDGSANLVRELRTERASVTARWEGDFLYVGIRSEPVFVASVCLARDDRVQVLHASAALGSVEYVRGERTWTRNGSFDWEVRDNTLNEAAMKERQRYLDLNGWIGTTVPMGERGQTEFIINARLVPPGSRIVAALMPESDPETIVELMAEANGCNTHALVAGPAPDELIFNPEAWPEVPARPTQR